MLYIKSNKDDWFNLTINERIRCIDRITDAFHGETRFDLDSLLDIASSFDILNIRVGAFNQKLANFTAFFFFGFLRNP